MPASPDYYGLLLSRSLSLTLDEVPEGGEAVGLRPPLRPPAESSDESSSSACGPPLDADSREDFARRVRGCSLSMRGPVPAGGVVAADCASLPDEPRRPKKTTPCDPHLGL